MGPEERDMNDVACGKVSNARLRNSARHTIFLAPRSVVQPAWTAGDVLHVADQRQRFGAWGVGKTLSILDRETKEFEQEKSHEAEDRE